MQLPALEDVYDLSTADLRKVQQSLRLDPTGHEQLLETIVLQIQERKALEYFTELCRADNPYAKKVAAFNEQFLRLAAETIQQNHQARQTGTGDEKQILLPAQLDNPVYSPTPPPTKHPQADHNQYSSLNAATNTQTRKYSQTQVRSLKSQASLQSDAMSTTTENSLLGSQNKEPSTSRVTKQSKTAPKKGAKTSKMKEMMMQTLARTKVEDDVVIRRNAMMPPHESLYPQKKYHIPGEKHETTELRSTGNGKTGNVNNNSSKDIKSKKDVAVAAQKSSKSIQESKNVGKSASEDNNRKRQHDIQTKMKEESKKGTVKLPKINHNKQFVEMVKMEEEKRRARELRLTQQALPRIGSSQSEEREPGTVMENRTKQPQMKQKQEITTAVEQIVEEIQPQIRQNDGTSVIHDVIQTQIDDNVIREQEIQESLSPEKLQQIKQKTRNKVEVNVSEQEAAQTKIQQLLKIKAKHQSQDTEQAHYALTQNAKQKAQFNQASTTVKVHQTQTLSVNKQSQQQDIDYTRRLIEQIKRQQEEGVELLHNREGEGDEQQNQQKHPQSPERTTTTEQERARDKDSPADMNKKCYSQQYWAHIREEAELKIKRFRQQKQYEEKKEQEKAHEVQKDQLSQNNDNQDEVKNQTDQSENNSPGYLKLKQQQQAFEKEILEKQQQLNKMKKQFAKRATKAVQAQPVPRPVRPKPDFDYLAIYPTFNHIFSVMYLKPQSQAVAQIPNIMRQVKTLFTTHMQHFSNKSNFKPAIFLPFDNNGAFQLTNPKQLIAHAQDTYIDLKVMIERVQIFNQNLHGDFNDGAEEQYYRVVKTREEVYDIITTSCMRRKGWKELPHGCSLRASWNLFWSWSKPDIDVSKLLVWQRINHFPFNKNLSRKDLLYKNLDYFRKNYKVPINFLPLTYNLPKEFSQLSAKFHEQEMLNREQNYWIMKPIGKSRGRGIKVVSSLSELNYIDNIVVQKYIANPMLLDGYKFDMRIYALVTSFHPLQAFVYREGFARLSTEKYSLDPHSIKNTFVHLTNFAINKNNVGSNAAFSAGSKISLKALKDKITRMGHSFANIWSQVHDIIIKSLLGCSVSVPSFPTAFELFGYDIMVDQDCNCHLIEINTSPSLERSYMIDEIVKQNLIDDIIDIVDPPNFDKKELLDVLTERINALTGKKKPTAEDDLIALARILKYKPIRKVGEMPTKMGLFEMIAPSEPSRQIEKLIKAKSGANNPMNID